MLNFPEFVTIFLLQIYNSENKQIKVEKRGMQGTRKCLKHNNGRVIIRYKR